MRLLRIILLLLMALPALAINPPTNLTMDPGASIGFDNGAYRLTVTLHWQNNDNTALWEVVQNSGDGGATYTNSAETDVHNHPTTTHVVKLLEGDYKIFRVIATTGPVNSSPSNLLPVWGEEQPASFFGTVISTNEVQTQWKNQSGTASTGFELQRSTNSDFSTLVDAQSIRAGTNGEVMFASNTGFLLDVQYYWRVRATNSLSYATEWSSTFTSKPASKPGIPAFFQARTANHSGIDGIDVQYGHGDGVADLWFVQVSVGSTNSFATIISTVNPANTYFDTAETPGSVCYYRALGSNQCGVVSSPIQKVIMPTSAVGSVWYIDLAATGDNSGSSWANAWPNFGSIAWGNIKPGALVWVAPGLYDETVFVSAGGTNGAPVTFKLATTNAPHGEGFITLRAVNNFIGGNVYLKFDGARSDNFQVAGKSDRELIPNMGWKFLGTTNIAKAIYTYAEGMGFFWLDISGPYVNGDPPSFGEGSTGGIFFHSGLGTNSEIAYCWIHDMIADDRSGAEGVWWTPSSGGNAFSGLHLHHTIIERVRDNYMSGGGSIEINNCIMGPWVGPPPTKGAHPDGMQPGAGYWLIYNNEVFDTPGSCLYPEVVQTNTTKLYIYNNIFHGTGAVTNESTPSDPWYPRAAVYPGSGIQFSTEPGLKDVAGNSINIGVMSVSNVLVANNTFYGFDYGYLSVSRREAECSSITMRDWAVLNNLAVTHNGGSQFGAGYLSSPSDIPGTNFTTSDVIEDWNSISGVNNFLGWGATNYTPQTITQIGFLHNTTNAPQFTDIATADFHLTNPTNLIGTNLTAWYPNLPMLNRNYDGTLRTVTGWPMGAQAANQGDGLIVWLSFSIYDGSHDVTDASPGGHDGILPHGDNGEDVHTNWPTLVSGPPRNGYQGVSFPPLRYFGITNLNGLNPISNFTVCTWYRIPATDANGLSDCTLFDTGLGDQKTNAVHLGRWNSAGFGLWVVANNGFPTNAVPIAADTPGVDTGWHFVAYTFASGKVVGYFDGAPVGTNTVPCDFVQVVNDDSPYASIGTFTHSRSFNPIDPEGASGPSGSYPNGGFGSQMADFRIYDRVKSAAEINAIYEGQGAGPGNPPPPPNTCVIVTTNTTPFTNTYDSTMLLTLTVQKIVGSKTFSEWRQDSSSFTNGQSAIVDLTTDHSMEAVYTNTPNDLGRRFFKVKRK